jgi:hypothetical protein
MAAVFVTLAIAETAVVLTGYTEDGLDKKI